MQVVNNHENMFIKTNVNLKFSPKRNFNLVTPCCNKSNKDGKFVNYKELPEIYGYCHSCGRANIPSDNNLYIIDDNTNVISDNYIPLKFIPESTIWKHFHFMPENNLLQYLRNTYGNIKVDDAKETYVLGSSNDSGIFFWSINSDLKVQKAKIAYYDENGKRTNKFKVPFKNEDGYYNCLFGEHLIYDKIKGKKTIVLVESEKTAIVGYILLPKYVWLAYGGINGLTDTKLKCLIGHNVLIIPDMSENAVSIICSKIKKFLNMGINIKIWDMTEGKTDEELKLMGIYNNDLEDVFRKL